MNVIETLFPKLQVNGYHITSPETEVYNCVAWAAGAQNKWWWPFGDPILTDWPAGAPKQETVPAFQAMLADLGFVPCDSTELEIGYKKVAIFADADQSPMHVARQLPSGAWTSKLGRLEDIEHTLADLEGTEYGTVVLVMRRAAGGASTQAQTS
jgi:hypothetical protein